MMLVTQVAVMMQSSALVTATQSYAAYTARALHSVRFLYASQISSAHHTAPLRFAYLLGGSISPLQIAHLSLSLSLSLSHSLSLSFYLSLSGMPFRLSLKQSHLYKSYNQGHTTISMYTSDSMHKRFRQALDLKTQHSLKSAGGL